jgi:hypothetical protein
MNITNLHHKARTGKNFPDPGPSFVSTSPGTVIRIRRPIFLDFFVRALAGNGYGRKVRSDVGWFGWFGWFGLLDLVGDSLSQGPNLTRWGPNHLHT